MRAQLIIGFLLILDQSMVIAQQMFQWKDANGQVHYTDDPAVAMRAKAKTMDKPTAQKIYSTTSVSAEQIEARRIQEAQQAQQKAKAVANLAILKRTCKNSLSFIESLKRTGRITIPDSSDKSGYRYLSDDEVKAYIVKKQVEYDKRCSGL